MFELITPLSREEAIMEDISYPFLAEHRNAHEKLRMDVLSFCRDCESDTGSCSAQSVARFVSGWLVNRRSWKMEKANIFALKSLFRGVAFFVLGFTVFSSSAYSSQKVTFACNPFPPQKIDSGNPKNQGFDVELLREVLTRWQKESEFVFAPWKRAYKSAVKGKVSGLCSCSYRADRKKHFLFSQEVGKVFVGIFVPREKSNGPMAIEDFEGKTVGVVRGYNLEAELHDKNIRHIEANSERNLALMLSAGRLDAVYSFRDTFLYYANEEGLSQSFEFIKLRQSPYYVCLSKSAPKGEELKSIIDSGLESLRADGTYRKLRQKYFPAEAK